MPGEGGKRLQGTGLLNIAGEKIEYSGTLGHPIVFFQAGDCHLPFVYDRMFDIKGKEMRHAPLETRTSAA